MLHQLAILAVIAAELAEVVAVRHVVLEQLGEAAEAGVDRVALRVDDLRLREQQVDQPEEEIVGQQLVGDPLGIAGAVARAPADSSWRRCRAAPA